MKQVTPQLFVGDLYDAEEPEAIEAADVTAVLKLTPTDPEAAYPDAVTVVEHPLVDGPDNEYDDFEAAVESLRSLLADGETVLVHCAAGISRSGAVTTAALAGRDGLDAEAALERVQSRKPNVNPHPHLLDQVRRYVDAA